MSVNTSRKAPPPWPCSCCSVFTQCTISTIEWHLELCDYLNFPTFLEYYIYAPNDTTLRQRQRTDLFSTVASMFVVWNCFMLLSRSLCFHVCVQTTGVSKKTTKNLRCHTNSISLMSRTQFQIVAILILKQFVIITDNFNITSGGSHVGGKIRIIMTVSAVDKSRACWY